MVNTNNMDLMETALMSFSNYFKYVGEYGTSKVQDKFKLLILFFLYRLLYNTTYIFDLQLQYASVPDGEEAPIIDASVSESHSRIRNVKAVIDRLFDCITENSCCVIVPVNKECNACIPDFIADNVPIYLLDVIGTNNNTGMVANTDPAVEPELPEPNSGTEEPTAVEPETPPTAKTHTIPTPNWNNWPENNNPPTDLNYE